MTPEIQSDERQKLLPLLQHPFTMATVLYAITYRLYGEDIHNWDPETLSLELQDDFGEGIPEINLSKIHALITAVSTNSFYHHWGAFMAICKTLNNSEDPVEMDDPLLVAEMAWAVTEVRLADDKPHEWNHDVKAFVGKILEEEGFTKPPHPLHFATMPEVYHGSDYPADITKQEGASTEHTQVVQEYMQEQALLLMRQLSALPWQTPDSLEKMSQEVSADR